MNIHANMVDNLNSNYENLNNIYTQETGYFMNAEEYVSSKFNKPAQAREKPAVPPKPKIYLKRNAEIMIQQKPSSIPNPGSNVNTARRFQGAIEPAKDTYKDKVNNNRNNLHPLNDSPTIQMIRTDVQHNSLSETMEQTMNYHTPPAEKRKYSKQGLQVWFQDPPDKNVYGSHSSWDNNIRISKEPSQSLFERMLKKPIVLQRSPESGSTTLPSPILKDANGNTNKKGKF